MYEYSYGMSRSTTLPSLPLAKQLSYSLQEAPNLQVMRPISRYLSLDVVSCSLLIVYLLLLGMLR